MGSDDLLDHGRRIAQLERKVAELYELFGQPEPATGFDGGFASDTAPESADPRVIELIQAGNEIAAIKLYRELTGLGLSESKQAVDKLRETYGPTT